ncbi:MAG TPA: LuxR C-terminal-related transcriptional regulator [Opitutaceae bacterium]|nr:LuxR C-terminal-related transcriptional regulator [Opitutaceae bacterium]HND61499.1 LuxR C-terminal-related transcriptional regulator [Opitutaceae bacterium]
MPAPDDPGRLMRTRLTPAEWQVTGQLRLGLSNKEIAVVLGKSPATIKAQVASVLSKLEQPTRCRLIAWLHLNVADAFPR